MLYLVSYIISDSLSFNFDTETMANLSVYCANSKRKRLPNLCAFANAA